MTESVSALTITDNKALYRRFTPCIFSHAPVKTCVLILICVLTSINSYAGPPYVTDDPEPVEYQHFEVFLSSIYQNVGGTASGTLPHVEVNYGPVPNLQLALTVPVAFSTVPAGPMLYGPGDVEIGAKYRIIQEGKSMPMVSLYPQFVTATGNVFRGLGGGHLQTLLPVWLQKSWGPWTTFGGGAYIANPGLSNYNYWQSGWLIQRDISKKWTFGLEIYNFTPSAVGIPDQFNFNFGGQFNIDEGHHIIFAFGRSISGTTRFMSYVGHQWTFGLHKEAPKGEDEAKQKD